MDGGVAVTHFGNLLVHRVEITNVEEGPTTDRYGNPQPGASTTRDVYRS